MATSLQRDVVASPTVASTVGDLQATIRSLVNERRQLRDRLGQGRNFGGKCLTMVSNQINHLIFLTLRRKTSGV